MLPGADRETADAIGRCTAGVVGERPIPSRLLRVRTRGCLVVSAGNECGVGSRGEPDGYYGGGYSDAGYYGGGYGGGYGGCHTTYIPYGWTWYRASSC